VSEELGSTSWALRLAIAEGGSGWGNHRGNAFYYWPSGIDGIFRFINLQRVRVRDADYQQTLAFISLRTTIKNRCRYQLPPTAAIQVHRTTNECYGQCKQTHPGCIATSV